MTLRVGLSEHPKMIFHCAVLTKDMYHIPANESTSEAVPEKSAQKAQR